MHGGADGEQDLADARHNLYTEPDEALPGPVCPPCTVVGRAGAKLLQGFATKEAPFEEFLSPKPPANTHWTYGIRHLKTGHTALTPCILLLNGKGAAKTPTHQCTLPCTLGCPRCSFTTSLKPGDGHVCGALLKLSRKSASSTFVNAGAKPHVINCHPVTAARLLWGTSSALFKRKVDDGAQLVAQDAVSKQRGAEGGGGKHRSGVANSGALSIFNAPKTASEQTMTQMKFYINLGMAKSLFISPEWKDMLTARNPVGPILTVKQVAPLIQSMLVCFFLLFKFVMNHAVEFALGGTVSQCGHDAVTLEGKSYQCMFVNVVWNFEKLTVYFAFKPYPLKTNKAIALLIRETLLATIGRPAAEVLYALMSDCAADGVADELDVDGCLCRLHQFDKIFKYGIGINKYKAEEDLYDAEDEFRETFNQLLIFWKRPAIWSQLEAAAAEIGIKAIRPQVGASGTTRMASAQGQYLSAIRLYQLAELVYAAWLANDDKYGVVRSAENTDGFVDLPGADEWDALVAIYAIGCLSQYYIVIVQYGLYFTGAFGDIFGRAALDEHKSVMGGTAVLQVVDLPSMHGQTPANFPMTEMEVDDLEDLPRTILETSTREAENRCEQPMNHSEMVAVGFDPRTLSLEHIEDEGVKAAVVEACEDEYTKRFVIAEAKRKAAMPPDAAAAAAAAATQDTADTDTFQMPALKRTRSGPDVKQRPAAGPAPVAADDSVSLVAVGRAQFKELYPLYAALVGNWIDTPEFNSAVAATARAKLIAASSDDVQRRAIQAMTDKDLLTKSKYTPTWSEVVVLPMGAVYKRLYNDPAYKKFQLFIIIGVVYSAADMSNAQAEGGNSVAKDTFGTKKYNQLPEEKEGTTLLRLNKRFITKFEQVYANELAAEVQAGSDNTGLPTQVAAALAAVQAGGDGDEDADGDYTIDFFVKKAGSRATIRAVESRYPKADWVEMKKKAFYYCKYTGYGRKEDVSIETSAEYKLGKIPRLTFFTQLMALEKLQKDDDALYKKRVDRWT